MDTLFYEGFFARDPLLARDTILFSGRPANASEIVGKPGMPMPTTAARNDIVTGSLLVSFALLLLILRAGKSTMRNRLLAFVFPTSSKHPSDTDTSPANNGIINFFLSLLTALLLGLLFFCYAQQRYNISLMPVSPLELLACYVGATLAAILLQALLYKIVHAVFFTRQQRSLWMQNFSILFLVQSIMLFPLTLLAVYFDLSTTNAAYALLFLLLFVKILLLFKAYSTFFVKFYGILHLFVYFCALEAAPLVILWSLLTQMTIYLEQF